MEKINVDLIPNENDLKIIHASQNDTESRRFGFKLFSQEGYYDVPEITNIDLKYDTETGGTETLLPVNTSTPTTTPLNAIINGDEVYFNERVSDGNKQNIEKIKGNTLVFNQLVQNGNFVDNTYWNDLTMPYHTYSINNNVLTLTLINSSISSKQINHTVELTTHKYLVSFEIERNITNSSAKIAVNLGGTIITHNAIANNTKTRISLLFNLSSVAYNFLYLYYVNASATQVYDGETIKISNVNIVDLTLMFGAGNEPTSVSDFTDLFPLPYYNYNAGSLLSFNGTGLKTENASQTENITLSLPVSTYFPTGMKSAGSVYDELTPTKATTRIGAVDLGTLNWSQRLIGGTPIGMQTNGLSATIKNPSTNSDIANIISTAGTASSWTKAMGENSSSGLMAVSGGYLFIATTETKPTAFKSAMSGVYLYYELATPTEEEFTTGYLICSNGAEIALYEEDDMLICECEKSLTGESGTFDCKIRFSSEDEQISSNKFRLKVEERP